MSLIGLKKKPPGSTSDLNCRTRGPMAESNVEHNA